MVPVIDASESGKLTITVVDAKPGSPVAVEKTLKLIDETSCSLKISSSVTKDGVMLDTVLKKQ